MPAASQLVAMSRSWLLCVVALVTQWRAQAMAAEPLLDVFPPSVVDVPAAGRGQTTITRDDAPSGSVWAEGLDERQVFLAELAHRQGKDDSFALRVGQGGQIYSLRGAFGESVPPSWRDAGNHRSPWNDEVWQFVAVCTKYNGVDALKKAGAVPRLASKAKVILAGEIQRKVALKGLLATKGARAAIEKAGGSVEQPAEKAGS